MNDPPTITVLVAWLIVAVMFVGIGLFIRYTPASRLLTWDQSTAYWVYNPELRRSGDKDKALASAARYYRTFGLFCALFGMLHVVVVIAQLLLRLWKAL
jgi:hypothetical protein